MPPGPFGSLACIRTDLPAVFIAGGIGITPFMSILRQAAQEQSLQHFLLLYSNREPEEAAFLAIKTRKQRDEDRLFLATGFSRAVRAAPLKPPETA